MQSLHLLQARFSDSSKSNDCSRHIIGCKLWNLWHLLGSHLASRRLHATTRTLLHASIYDIRTHAMQLDTCRTKNESLLIEARASKSYWHAYARVIGAPLDWHRVHPGALDTWNQALNIGYTLLLTKTRHAVLESGLDPEIGILHSSRSAKEALVYDLMELFRQPVVDRAVIRIFSHKKIADAIAIDPKTVIRHVEALLDKRIRFRGRIIPVRTALRMEPVFFRRSLLHDEPYSPYRYSWAHPKTHKEPVRAP